MENLELREKIIKCILSSGFYLDDDARTFNTDEISDDCPLYDLGIEDSLDELELIINLEEVINEGIADEEVEAVKLVTVGDVLDLAESKLVV